MKLFHSFWIRAAFKINNYKKLIKNTLNVNKALYKLLSKDKIPFNFQKINNKEMKCTTNLKS
jgi:hypothetical protein